MIQKHTKGRKIGCESELGFPVSEADSLAMNAKSLVGSVMANFCGSPCPLHMSMVIVPSQRVMIDKAFSMSKVVWRVRTPHH